MNARLFCKTGQLAGAEYSIGREATIGSATGNTIQLYPGVISGRHARIFLDEKSGRYLIEDFNSSNGTRVDGMSVRGTMRLENLHVITFAGSFDFLFQVMDATGERPKPSQETGRKSPASLQSEQQSDTGKTMYDDADISAPVLGRKPAAESEERQSLSPPSGKQGSEKATMFDDVAMSPPSLGEKPSPPSMKEKTVVGMNFEATPNLPSSQPASGEKTIFDDAAMLPPEIKSPQARDRFFVKMIVAGEAKEFLLMEGENIVGREEGCAVRLNDASVSRRHACITLKQGNVFVRDLGSKNHTFIGSESVTRESEVPAGSLLVFGMVKTELIQRP